MTRPKGTIFKEPDLNMRLLILNFKDLLYKYYGSKSGAIKKFCNERHLNRTKVYRQWNDDETMSAELLKEMEAFEKKRG